MASYATEGEAKKRVEALRLTALQAGERTLREHVEAVTYPARRNQIKLILGAGGLLDAIPSDVTEDAAQDAYRALRELRLPSGRPYAIATQHAAVRATRWLWRQFEADGIVDGQVWDLRVQGRARHGKHMLRRDEALRWLLEAERRAWAGSALSLGCVIGLYCGLRSAEVQRLQARDVSGGGTLLHVEGTKTENSVRDVEIEVPVLSRLLVVHTADRAPTDRIVPHGQKALREEVARIALAAGVDGDSARRLCFQALRGMAETLARRGGGIPALVAAGIGHTVAVADRHYVAQGTDVAVRQEAILRAVGGGGFSQDVPSDLQPGEKKGDE